MSTKEQLINELDEAHHEFRAAVEDLDEHTFETKWQDGRWGVREIVAHITGWHGKLASALERMARGEKPVPEGEDWSKPDEYNAVFAEHVKGKQQDEVMAELEHAVRSFKEAAMKVPDERYGEGKTANKLFDGAGIGHFREHAEAIRAWRAQPAMR